jgi:homoserine dehydrogenase
MEEAGGGFEDALELAKKKGYAEKDPTLDINGADSSHKLAILARLGFGLAARPKEIYTEGIIDIDPLDIQYARELGYAIRLLAIAKRSGAELELRVHPTLIAKDHPLANVRGVYNAIFLKGDLVGELLFYGQGAGRLPAASSVVSDIICIARSTAKGIPALESSGSAAGWCRKLSDIDRTMSRYYIRFSAIDRPGVLKKIAGILAGRKISIASVTQKEKRSQRIVPIVMMTHAAQERAMAAAVREIDHLSVIKKKSVKIRIED